MRTLFQNKSLLIFLQFADLRFDTADFVVDIGDFVRSGVFQFFAIFLQIALQARKILCLVENQTRGIDFVGVHRFQFRSETQRVDKSSENRDFLFFLLKFFSPDRNHLLRDSPSEQRILIIPFRNEERGEVSVSFALRRNSVSRLAGFRESFAFGHLSQEEIGIVARADVVGQNLLGQRTRAAGEVLFVQFPAVDQSRIVIIVRFHDFRKNSVRRLVIFVFDEEIEFLTVDKSLDGLHPTRRTDVDQIGVNQHIDLFIEKIAEAVSKFAPNQFQIVIVHLSALLHIADLLAL